MAEYVKVGSVSLLLDMIESGSQKLPNLKSPLHALGRIAGDWHLVSRVATSHGEMSALEIQKKYLAAAESYVDSVPAGEQVKRCVLTRWRGAGCRWHFIKMRMTLKMLWERSTGSQNGSCSMNSGAIPNGWQKKIDLRYHNCLQGYFWKLATTMPDVRLVETSIIEGDDARLLLFAGGTTWMANPRVRRIEEKCTTGILHLLEKEETKKNQFFKPSIRVNMHSPLENAGRKKEVPYHNF